MPRRKAEKLKLDKTLVAQLEPHPDGRPRIVYDTELKGLLLNIAPSRAEVRPGEPPPPPRRVWWVYRWHAGAPRRWRIGDAAEIGPDEARRLGEGLVGDVRKGRDPQQARRDRRKSMVGQDYLERLYLPTARLRKRSWRNDAAYLQNHAQPILARRLVDITRDHVLELQAALAAKLAPATVNKVLSLLRTMLQDAVDRGHLATNPAARVKALPVASRKRHLRPDEAGRFLAALAETAQPWQDVFALCLWTGVRKGNVLAAAWAQVDLERRLWIIEDDAAVGVRTKTGRTYTIALVDQALEILRRRRRAAAKGSRWVFPATGRPTPSGHLENPYRAWRDLAARAGMPDLHVHDLRRTAGVWMVRTGASTRVIADALGHSTLRAVEHYSDAADPELVRRELGKATRALERAAKPKGGRRA